MQAAFGRGFFPALAGQALFQAFLILKPAAWPGGANILRGQQGLELGQLLPLFGKGPLLGAGVKAYQGLPSDDPLPLPDLYPAEYAGYAGAERYDRVFYLAHKADPARVVPVNGCDSPQQKKRQEHIQGPDNRALLFFRHGD